MRCRRIIEDCASDKYFVVSFNYTWLVRVDRQPFLEFFLLYPRRDVNDFAICHDLEYLVLLPVVTWSLIESVILDLLGLISNCDLDI